MHMLPLLSSSLPSPGECEALDGELRAARESLAELQGERDELAASLAAAEAEAANTADDLEAARRVAQWGAQP